jgi:hypothetical protein
MDPGHLRVFVCLVAENTCDNLEPVTELLQSVYTSDAEEFEVFEAFSLLSKQDWWWDLLPRSRDKQQKAMHSTIFQGFPFLEKMWNKVGEDDDEREESSADTYGSLDDFIVSDDSDPE